MDLLPRTHHEFGSKDYWEKFFHKRGAKAFEWYGEFSQLCGTLTKYCKPTDLILVAGCGNSDLSADLYDVGYRNIVSVDISTTVIRQMTSKYEESRPDLKFLQMDLLEMSFAENEFSVVLDKGTVDAIFTDESPEVVGRIDKMLAEIGRVLRIGGRFICVSLAQQHIIGHVVRYFANEGWMTRICRVPESSGAVAAEGRAEFQLPVFVFVFTKFRKMPNAKLILELAYFEEKPERFETIDALLEAVRELQRYAVIRQQLSTGGRLEEQMSLDLYSSSVTSVPRYTIYIVDGPRTLPLAKKFAIFIVPQGRETEWMFSTDEGRMELQRTAGFERLLVVTLHREHTYDDLDAIKAELGERVLELAPRNVAKQSPFLSIGDAVNLRSERYRGASDISGEFVVEDVDVNGQTFRRLIFLSNRNLVQSEARLVKESTKKTGGKKKNVVTSTSYTVDHNHLASNYYGTIVAGLAFVDDLPTLLDSGLHVTLIGLGGGGLAMFLRNNIPKVKIDVVEIDQSIVSVATAWFGLVQNDQLVVHVADGLEYIQRLNSQGHQTDVVILDVDSKDVSRGMSCPPAAFVDVEFLRCVNGVLKPNGLMMLNLVCRSREQRDLTVDSLKSVFMQVFSVKVPDDVNETLYCIPTTRPRNVDINPNGKTGSVAEYCSTIIPAINFLQNTVHRPQGRQQRTAAMAKDNMLYLTEKLDKLKLL
jgi:SAM-dependent methyltransferase